MAEYIEREAVMQAFSDYVWNSNHSDLVPAPQWNHAVDIVRDYPAADVVPVRHGRWLSMDSEKVIAIDDDGCPVDSCRCSECGDWLTGSDEYMVRGRYCPNCGAKMNKDGDGE